MCYCGDVSVLNKLLDLFPDLDLEQETSEETAQLPRDIALVRGHTEFVTTLQTKLDAKKNKPAADSLVTAPTHKKKFIEFSKLTQPIMAQTLSFIVESMRDLDNIRLVSKDICQNVIPWIPTMGGKIVRYCRSNNKTFVEELLAEGSYEELLKPGDQMRTKSDRYPLKSPFPGFLIDSVIFLYDGQAEYEYDKDRIKKLIS